MINSGKTH